MTAEVNLWLPISEFMEGEVYFLESVPEVTLTEPANAPLLLAAGGYSTENNLRTVIEARSETGGNFLCGVASDERETDRQVDELAKSLAFALETKHTAPQNFWGVGGMKIFRDLIYQMRGMMRADHKFYKSRAYMIFPRKSGWDH